MGRPRSILSVSGPRVRRDLRWLIWPAAAPLGRSGDRSDVWGGLGIDIAGAGVLTCRVTRDKIRQELL